MWLFCTRHLRVTWQCACALWILLLNVGTPTRLDPWTDQIQYVRVWWSGVSTGWGHARFLSQGRAAPAGYHPEIFGTSYIPHTVGYNTRQPNFAWSNQMSGKLLQSRPCLQPKTKFFVTQMLTRDLFAIANRLPFKWHHSTLNCAKIDR